jgi:hypothetical protein
MEINKDTQNGKLLLKSLLWNYCFINLTFKTDILKDGTICGFLNLFKVIKKHWQNNVLLWINNLWFVSIFKIFGMLIMKIIGYKWMNYLEKSFK